MKPMKIMAWGSSGMPVSVSGPECWVWGIYLMAKNDANETHKVSRYISLWLRIRRMQGQCVYTVQITILGSSSTDSLDR